MELCGFSSIGHQTDEADTRRGSLSWALSAKKPFERRFFGVYFWDSVFDDGFDQRIQPIILLNRVGKTANVFRD